MPCDSPLIAQEHIQAFQRDGAVCLRQLLSPAAIATLREGIDYNLRHLSTRAKVASRPEDPGLFVEDFCTWQDNSYYQEIIFHHGLGAVAALLMASQQVRLYHDHLLVKEAHTQQSTPWHQDQPYYNVAGRQNVSFWIPVDPINRVTTLEFVAGSHLGPWLMPRSFMTQEAKWFPPGSLAELPDIEAKRQQFPIIGWATEPGDVVCFHMLTLHAAPGVAGSVRRRVFSVRFLGDDMVHAPRAWDTSPAFPGLVQELPAGAAMDHPLFPLVPVTHTTAGYI